MKPEFRPPAVPLVTIDPYTSCWSFADRLYDDWPRHWTGTAVRAVRHGARRRPSRCGSWAGPEVLAESVRQIALEVQPTQTIYRFDAGPVDLEVRLHEPAARRTISNCSRAPRATSGSAPARCDGAPHEVALYLDMTLAVGGQRAAPEGVVGRGGRRRSPADPRLSLARTSRSCRKPATICASTGERRSSPCPGAPRRSSATSTTAAPLSSGAASSATSTCCRCRASPRTGASRCSPSSSTSAASASRDGEALALVGYDDEYAVEYFGQPVASLVAPASGRIAGAACSSAASADAAAVLARCTGLRRHLARRGRARRRRRATRCSSRSPIGRRSPPASSSPRPMAAPFFFSKENFSNACMGTVDVNYKSAPLFLYANPELMKRHARPDLRLLPSDAWPLPVPGARPRPVSEGQRSGLPQLPSAELDRTARGADAGRGMRQHAHADHRGVPARRARRLRRAATGTCSRSGPTTWSSTGSIRSRSS